MHGLTYIVIDNVYEEEYPENEGTICICEYIVYLINFMQSFINESRVCNNYLLKK